MAFILSLINHSLNKPLATHGNFTLDFFWCQNPELLKPREDFLFLSYQKFKHERISALSKPKDPSHMDIPPHSGPGLVPTLLIPPIYIVVPPPTSHKGKRPTFCISEPSEFSSIPPLKREEKKPMLIYSQPLQISSRTKRNRSARDCR